MHIFNPSTHICSYSYRKKSHVVHASKNLGVRVENCKKKKCKTFLKFLSSYLNFLAKYVATITVTSEHRTYGVVVDDLHFLSQNFTKI